ncbi:MAG TPA: hypothetical protein PLV59_04090 [Candidatus Dojkabacteria bacterium]|nr:hypothetical protein [Candidatus Dojkabacteria bacterium]
MESIILFDIDGTIVSENNPFVTYDDVKPVLQTLKEEGYKLGLYSQGFWLIQLLKVTSKGLRKYFSKDLLLISHDKFETLKKKRDSLGNTMFIVDNDTTQVEKIKNAKFSSNVVPIHLNRHSFQREAAISSLSELPNLLTSLNVVHKI